MQKPKQKTEEENICTKTTRNLKNLKEMDDDKLICKLL
jgi:hypothetical protein